MKIKIQLLTILMLNLVSISARAQEISCDDFCVTEVRMDTSVPNLMYVSLFFAGADNDFINYPWIAEVLDEQGDTVGVGTWNFFGQFGNSSNEYPVTVDFDSIPDNFNATIVFHYDTSVCLLRFPCTNTGIADPYDIQQVSIYPNPFSSETLVHSDIPFKNMTLKIFDTQGNQVQQIENLTGNEITLTVQYLLTGIYFVQLLEQNKIVDMKKMVITN